MIRTLARAIISIWLGMATVSQAQTAYEAETLTRAVTAMRSDDWQGALRAAESAGAVARDIVEWHRLRAGLGDFDDTLAFLARRPDWPGLPLLRQRTERNLPFGTRADEVIAFFGESAPQTGGGAVTLVAAHRAAGHDDAAMAAAVEAWRTQILSQADENALMTWYADALKPHHAERLDMLLWRDAGDAAERMYRLVSGDLAALGRARLALRENRKGVDALVEKVPARLMDDPGLAFERMQWRARKGRNEAAIDLMLAQGEQNLGKPGYWAGWRRSLARSEMRAGRIDTAYRLASEHGLTSGSSFADLEWLSGYIQLTYMGDGDAALVHFLRFRGAVETPISLGRAGYWEGRAHELRGDAESARLAYAYGAEYQTSFYGLLAAEKAGIPLDPELYKPAPAADWRRSGFADSSVFEAGRLLLAAGEHDLAERFLTHLSELLSKEDIETLAAWALEQDEPHLAVMIGKRAASRDIVVPFAYFALADLGVDPMPVPRELALSIARRESEFDPGVTSGAGARGLMQVMPATAKEVAEGLEIPFSRDRLLSDPAYNARIGTAYLDELMTAFDSNIVMVSAAYNAGPSRPLRWMDERGDPRRGGMNVVDWIEHIPFDETRNYVMRVAESVPVYRARLSGTGGPVTLTRDLLLVAPRERQAVAGLILRPRARPAILTD